MQSLKTIVNPKITFSLNEFGKVNVYEDGIKITSISTPIYALLSMFNGEMTEEEIKDVLAQFGGIEKSQGLLDVIKNKFRYILQETDDLKRELHPYPLTEYHVNFSRMRSIVPQTIVISLTRDCFMKCRYCYAGALYSSESRIENTLDMSLIKKIIHEIKKYGVTRVNLTGGDPFIRRDIFYILELFGESKISVDISTKKIFTDQELLKILTFKDNVQLQISLDSLDDAIQESMTGREDYSSQMVIVLENLIRSGFEVNINTVITSLNIESIPNLLIKLDQIGVKQCTLSPYTNNLWRSVDELFPSHKQYLNLHKKLNELKIKMVVKKETYLKTLDNTQVEREQEKRVCSAGEDGLVIGPSGCVAICERLVYHPEFSIGNIKDQTLLEIWNSDKLQTFYSPEKDLFKGTPCFECEQLRSCVEIRGICYVNSLILHGLPFAPDSFCKFYNGTPRIF